ncbi:MAG: ABC transporter ATP-binding protein/permease [bacterium]|nr:ABC transporter ATP-binding protein/permease [bacterium]
MRQFFRFLRNALRYKPWLLLALISILGVSTFELGSMGTILPFFGKVVTNELVRLPQPVITALDKFSVLIPNLRTRVDHLVDQINHADRRKLLIAIAVFLVTATFLKGLFDFTMKVSMEIVAQNVMRDFMSRMYRHLQQLPIQYFSKTRTGELVSRITSDVHLVQAALSAQFVDCLAEAARLPIYMAVALFWNWKMSLLAAIGLPLLMGPIVHIGQRVRRLSKKTQEKVADIISLLTETIIGIRIVRAFNMEQYEIDRFEKLANRFRSLRISSIRREAAISPLTELVGVTILVLVALNLFLPVLEGREKLNNVAMFCGALLLMLKPFRSIAKLNNIVQRASAAIRRIYTLLDTPITIKEAPGAISLPPLQHEIRFEHVYFAYEPDAPPVIKDLNLTVHAGEFIAIVGPSGSGKTTLVNLIPRFYEVTSGAILIDGVDIRDVTFSSLRQQIGMVTQETVLFNDTVRNNIAYGRADIPLEQIVAAAQAANADAFIRELPQGYDTLIGEHGVRLSGGQRQRLAIARAILKNPRILILDEATSSLDTESERLVQEAIDRLVANRTVFAIAHRLSTVQHADRILVLHDGEAVQIGSHDALIADEDGLYKKLHDLQFRDTTHSIPSGFLDFIKMKIRQARDRRAQRAPSSPPPRNNKP